MAEEIAFENGRISNFENLVTLTLTLTLVMLHLHTVVHHSSTSTYMPNFIAIEETFCGRTYAITYVRYGRTFETGFIRSTLSKTRPKKGVRGLFGSFKNKSSRLVRSVWFRFYSHKWTSRFTANRPNTNGLMHAQIVYAYYMYTLRTFFILYYLL